MIESNIKIIVYDLEDFIIIETLLVFIIVSFPILEAGWLKILCGIFITFLLLLNFTKVTCFCNEGIVYNNVLLYFHRKKIIKWEIISETELFHGSAMYATPILKLYNKGTKFFTMRIHSYRKVNEIRKIFESKGKQFKFKASPYTVKKILSK